MNTHILDFNLDNPAVYVGTYGKYNEGSIAGAWIDLSTFDSYKEFLSFCYEVHSDEDDPELMFQDFMNFPSELYHESAFSEDDFNAVLAYFNADDKDALDAFIDYYGLEKMSDFESYYIGYFGSKEDFARHIVDECYDLNNIMGSLSYYFDYEAYARDLFCGDFCFNRGYVFRC